MSHRHSFMEWPRRQHSKISESIIRNDLDSMDLVQIHLFSQFLAASAGRTSARSPSSTAFARVPSGLSPQERNQAHSPELPCLVLC